MATIKPIEGRSVHQIQSGQVIVDLCSVVKELVENSLDAGATTIEVRFKNNGLDAIEVQDNGGGISPDDFETIALKHYTSKLSSYDDLGSLQTFGFRGEALSSLCALSKFHVVTARAADAPKGTKLDFEISGKLKGTSVVASQKGTTVVVENLFYNLPVRRRELEKTIKREYSKVLLLLHAYACISVGIKLSVSNQMPKGKKTVAFSTNSNPNTKENIANVYSAKTLLALIPLDLKFEMDPTTGSTQGARNWSTQEDSGSKGVRIQGHISRPVVGEGRQTPDRQMFFVNSRPCLLPQVAKAFNEVYKSYNVTQSPFIFADIKLDTNAYDVNVSPDKRTILLHDQNALLESLKTALIELFEAHDQSVPQSQLSTRTKLPSYKALTLPQSIRGHAEEDEDEQPVSGKPSERELPDTHRSQPSPPSDVSQNAMQSSLIAKFASRNSGDKDTKSRPNNRRRNGSSEESAIPRRADDTVDKDVPGQLEVTIDSGSSSKSASENEEQSVPRPNARFTSARELLHSTEMDKQEEIPRIQQTPQSKSSQSTIQSAFDRMRPMRTPIQQATITVGDKTTVSTIGNASRSSRRAAQIHIPKYGFNGTPLSQTPKRPLFMKSLRGFAAPGTQAESDEDADEQSGEEDDTAEPENETEPDSSMPNTFVAVNSPSSRKRQRLTPTVTVSDPGERAEEESDESVQSEEEEAGDHDGQGKRSDVSEAEETEQAVNDKDDSDDEYIDEAEKKVREEAKIAQMIADVEEAAARPTGDNLKRATKLLSNTQKKYKTLELVRFTETSIDSIRQQAQSLQASLEAPDLTTPETTTLTPSELNQTTPEDRLSLTVTKSDFTTMRIIGQFNLGFILALRPPTPLSPTPDLFIIDQHASDEKYNFERLTASTILVPQRLVHPHPLELTAVEEEIILNNTAALTANGFILSLDTSGASAVGSRARLLSLPMSREVTFTPTDLEELLVLLSENPPTSSAVDQHIPRPSKVRKLLASRACRSSVMVGKTLSVAQMGNVVRHMGDMDKPWSCPHGRPTMRHLFSLGGWEGWREGDGLTGMEEERRETDWRGVLRRRRGRG